MNTSNNRILCVDYGTVRIGIAVSDPTLTFASPQPYIKNDCPIETIAAKIANLASNYNAKKIIIGNPKRLNGSEGSCHAKILELKTILEQKFFIEVILWDERLTSISAEKSLIEAGLSRKNRKEKIDSVAAALILQNYLDFLNNQKS